MRLVSRLLPLSSGVAPAGCTAFGGFAHAPGAGAVPEVIVGEDVPFAIPRTIMSHDPAVLVLLIRKNVPGAPNVTAACVVAEGNPVSGSASLKKSNGVTEPPAVSDALLKPRTFTYWKVSSLNAYMFMVMTTRPGSTPSVGKSTQFAVGVVPSSVPSRA